MDACVHCGACSDKCHYFLGTGDPKNMPVARQDLMRAVYRRYFTFAGKHFPKLVGAVDLTREVLDEWWSYYNQCSECRRCSVFCPYGIDTAEVTMAAREIMDSVGLGPEVQQRDHRQGAPHRQQPGPARARHWSTRWKAWKKTCKEDTGVDVRTRWT
jgi:Fe-S oxidoreductase